MTVLRVHFCGKNTARQCIAYGNSGYNAEISLCIAKI